MGKIFHAVFGGSSSKNKSSSTSESGNLGYNQINSQYSAPGADLFQRAGTALTSALDGGFDEYKNNIGFDFFDKLGLRKTAGGYSGRGVFNSGATLKGLADYENGISKAAYNDYLDKVLAQGNMGLAAGGLVKDAGDYSKSSSTAVGKSSSETGAFGKFLGAVLASDIRLKTDVEKIGEVEGLGVYSYNYIDGSGPHVGYMAHEVAEHRPDALGPVVGGYLTVDYSKLPEIE